MAPPVSKKQRRRRLSKSSKPENLPREQENIDPRSKGQSPTSSVSMTIPQITITPPSQVLQIDGYSMPRTDNSLYFISFSGCGHEGFHILSKNSLKDTFASSLKYFSPSTATPVEVTEMYAFDKPCPKCNRKASIPLENVEESFPAFSSMPLKSPNESMLAFLERSEKWVVSWPEVQPMVPNAIRRFGKFDFEDEGGEAQSKHESEVEGSNRAASLRSYKSTELRPIYVEDLRIPTEDSSTPAKKLGAPAKKGKARRRWRKVRMVSRLRSTS